MASRFRPRRATFTQGRLHGDRFAYAGRTIPRPA